MCSLFIVNFLPPATINSLQGYNKTTHRRKLISFWRATREMYIFFSRFFIGEVNLINVVRTIYCRICSVIFRKNFQREKLYLYILLHTYRANHRVNWFFSFKSNFSFQLRGVWKENYFIISNNYMVTIMITWYKFY